MEISKEWRPEERAMVLNGNCQFDGGKKQNQTPGAIVRSVHVGRKD